MKCTTCPYIKEELDGRIMTHIETYKEIPSFYFFVAEILSSCFCYKTGVRVFGCRCDDIESITEEDYENYLIKLGIYKDDSEQYIDPIKQDIDPLSDIKESKIQKKRDRDKRYKKYLQKLWADNRNRYLVSVYPCNVMGYYADESDEDFVRYKRVYNPRRAKFLKRMCNKKVRKGKDIPSRGGYRKYSGYKWELW